MYFVDETGVTGYLPASWTDVGPKDPFVEQSNGRAVARYEDLLALAELREMCVKRITP